MALTVALTFSEVASPRHVYTLDHGYKCNDDAELLQHTAAGKLMKHGSPPKVDQLKRKNKKREIGSLKGNLGQRIWDLMAIRWRAPKY